MQLFVGCRQPRVLLLKPRHQRDKLIPFRGGQAWGTAHSQSLNQHPALAATPLRATKPLINYSSWYTHRVLTTVVSFPKIPFEPSHVEIGVGFVPAFWFHMGLVTVVSSHIPYREAGSSLHSRRLSIYQYA